MRFMLCRTKSKFTHTSMTPFLKLWILLSKAHTHTHTAAVQTVGVAPRPSMCLHYALSVQADDSDCDPSVLRAARAREVTKWRRLLLCSAGFAIPMFVVHVVLRHHAALDVPMPWARLCETLVCPRPLPSPSEV